MLTIIGFYYLIINIAAFVLYGVDKQKAKKGKWRIPEYVLMLIAAVGGALGAFAGIHVFHHKTRKKKFTVFVPVMLALHVVVFGYFSLTTLQTIA